MQLKHLIRLSALVLAVSVSLMLFSYVRARASHQDDPNNECGNKCNKKVQTEYILWESITHNLLMVKR